MTAIARSPLTRVRYVALAVPNYTEAVEFYKNYWGLDVVAQDSHVTYFGTPAHPEQYIVRIRRSTDKRLDLISFAAETATEVDALAQRLGSAGISLVTEPHQLDSPGGGYGFRFFDPDGRLLEVSANVAHKAYRALEPRESIPQKLSHVVINSTDVLRTKQFYEDHLGFMLSDWLEDEMCFLRVRTDHHIIAIGHGPHTSLNHISFEMRGIDEFMRGTGRLMRAGKAAIWGPGRHGAGDNTFSYFLDPTGNVVEYTTELQRIDIDEPWQPRRFDMTPEGADQWGTSNLITEQMIPAMFNDPDKGLWVPAPI
ncbi:VOC family protein [Rhodococcus sp. IEGM 1351]|uniref:VOC family protein n=1 Tax=Rhodococcus sp. IEGM 1351 TaxID=3047089 RepID=UPI0024B6D2D6|nr:VOC family protein [Rhodococcus sp. IEGM 1351]MDI9939210.1 VOC family protein [Rhodococcus sp. IEGM 1351]